MAEVGKLVRLESGLWARFQKVPVMRDGADTGDFMWVAVELTEEEQQALSAQEPGLLKTFIEGVSQLSFAS